MTSFVRSIFDGIILDVGSTAPMHKPSAWNGFNHLPIPDDYSPVVLFLGMLVCLWVTRPGRAQQQYRLGEMLIIDWPMALPSSACCWLEANRLKKSWTSEREITRDYLSQTIFINILSIMNHHPFPPWNKSWSSQLQQRATRQNEAQSWGFWNSR